MAGLTENDKDVVIRRLMTYKLYNWRDLQSARVLLEAQNDLRKSAGGGRWHAAQDDALVALKACTQN